MDVRCIWKVLFTLYFFHSMLGCDVGARPLGSITHDVTESKASLNRSQADSINNVNTCLTNERNGTLICNNMTHGSDNNDTIKPDLDYTYQVDHLGKVISICFNFTNHGESRNYDRLIVNITETTDLELDRNVATDINEMRVYLSRFSFTYGNVNTRIQNISAVTRAGNFQKFRIGQKDAQVFTLKQCDRSGNCFNLNGNDTVSIWIISIQIGLTEVLIADACIVIFIAAIYWLKLWRRRNQSRANRHRRRLARLASAAPAG
ncbi:uncharacterized protein LOC131934865 [Physella acuta]|uniref:uncharacterized protein LOC131934865 n=1 Tax=Physella acuta TaxID=109671 RepID=UPI0027DAC5AC|nr:uncharacterized protein LOC131934865 [Physella acuta]